MSDSDTDSPIHAITSFSTILDTLNIPYLIGGSFASSVHGEFRTSNDIDYLASISEEHLDMLFKRLAADFVFDEIAIRNAVKERRSFNIFHEVTFIKIDVFTRVDPYRKEQLERAEKVKVLGTNIEVKVATPEDIILSKLAWHKLGNEVSELQWRDILGVLRVQGDKLDREYLNARAGDLEVSEILKRALKEAMKL